MDCDEAELTDHDLVVVIVFVIEADIAHDILIDFVLVNSDLLVGVIRVDLIAIHGNSSHLLVLLIDLHRLWLLLLLTAQAADSALTQSRCAKFAL